MLSSCLGARKKRKCLPLIEQVSCKSNLSLDSSRPDSVGWPNVWLPSAAACAPPRLSSPPRGQPVFRRGAAHTPHPRKMAGLRSSWLGTRSAADLERGRNTVASVLPPPQEGEDAGAGAELRLIRRNIVSVLRLVWLSTSNSRCWASSYRPPSARGDAWLLNSSRQRRSFAVCLRT